MFLQDIRNNSVGKMKDKRRNYIARREKLIKEGVPYPEAGNEAWKQVFEGR